MECNKFKLFVDPDLITDYPQDEIELLLDFVQQLNSLECVKEAQIDLDGQCFLGEVYYEDISEIEALIDKTEGLEFGKPDISDVFRVRLLEIPFIL